MLLAYYDDGVVVGGFQVEVVKEPQSTLALHSEDS